MVQTVIGIFENSDIAQKARLALIENGFDNRCIEINDHVDTVDELVTDGQMTDTSGKTSLYHNPWTASEGDRNGAMVTVHTVFNAENMLATDILNDFGAMDVNEFTAPQYQAFRS
jgi:hypothetical protein